MFRWVRDNPNLVAFMHALRVELTVRYVMSNVVLSDDENQVLFWLRFECGSNCNPHAHGLTCVKGALSFEHAIADADFRYVLIRQGYPQATKLHRQEPTEPPSMDFFNQYVNELHPW